MDRRHDRPRGVIPATEAHILELAATMRYEHRWEIRDVSRLSPFEALRHSVMASVAKYAVFHDNLTLFAMGVEPAGMLTGSAMVWMLGRREMDRHPAFVLRAARWGVDEAYRATGAGILEQWIPAWYSVGLRFVERLGFTVHGDMNGMVRVTHERGRSGRWAH